MRAGVTLSTDGASDFGRGVTRARKPEARWHRRASGFVQRPSHLLPHAPELRRLRPEIHLEGLSYSVTIHLDRRRSAQARQLELKLSQVTFRRWCFERVSTGRSELIYTCVISTDSSQES